MQNESIKHLLETAEELRLWNGYVTKERFFGYAQAKYGYDRNCAEKFYDVWERIAQLNFWRLKKVEDPVFYRAIDIARGAYEVVCKGGHISVIANEPRTPKWRIYYQTEEEGQILQMDLNLREKDDVIKYSLLLQQDGVEIVNRVDYYESVDVRYKDKNGVKVAIYDGDIIFCTQASSFSFCDNSGCYVCIDGCYKRLMYTPGRGYIRRGELDIEQDKDDKDCRYNDYVFNSFDREFKVVGNIFIDRSILKETECVVVNNEQNK